MKNGTVGYWMVPSLLSQDWRTLCPPGLPGMTSTYHCHDRFIAVWSSPMSSVCRPHMITSDTWHFLSSKRIAAMTSNQTGSLKQNHLEQINFKENGFKAAPILGVLVRKLMPLEHSSLLDTVTAWYYSTLKRKPGKTSLTPTPPIILFSGASSFIEGIYRRYL